MSIGSLFLGESFGNVLFGVSVLMLEYYYEVFLIKYNFGVFDEMSIMELLMKYKVLIMELVIK